MPPDAQPRSHHSLSEIQAASLLIARFRKALDATLGLPDWQDELQNCVAALQLPGQRQGISFTQAALSLPIESKRSLVTRLWSSDQIRLTPRSAAGLLQSWKIEPRPGARPGMTSRQWEENRPALKLRLATRYQGYKKAQALLYQCYDYIPKQAARELCFDPSKREDCEQEGVCGLLQAIDRIEPGKPFASYAFQWTRRRIRNFLLKNCLPLSAPVNLISAAVRADTESGRPASPELRSLSLALYALQAPAPEFFENGASLNEDPAPTPATQAARSELVEHLEYALQQLTAKQREVLALRFGLLQREGIDTLKEIARITGITRQQVSQREKRALSKLESWLSPLKNELA